MVSIAAFVSLRTCPVPSAISLRRLIAASSPSLRRVVATRVAPARAPAQRSTPSPMTALASPSWRRAARAVPAAVAEEAVVAADTAICNGRVTAGAFITCRAEASTRLLLLRRRQMKTCPLAPQLVAGAGGGGGGGKRPALPLPQLRPEAHQQLRAE